MFSSDSTSNNNINFIPGYRNNYDTNSKNFNSTEYDNEFINLGLYTEFEILSLSTDDKIKTILSLQEDVVYFSRTQYNEKTSNIIKEKERYKDAVQTLEIEISAYRDRYDELTTQYSIIKSENYNIKNKLGLFIKAALKFVKLNTLQKEISNIIHQQHSVEIFKSFFDLKSTELEEFSNKLNFKDDNKQYYIR